MKWLRRKRKKGKEEKNKWRTMDICKKTVDKENRKQKRNKNEYVKGTSELKQIRRKRKKEKEGNKKMGNNRGIQE